MYGGTKGPGKTESILRESLRQVNNPKYRCIIFRRTFPRLGEIIDRSFKYFPGLGLKFSDKDIQIKLPAWTAPSGAKIAFGHLQHEQDKYNYQGKEFHVQLFDEIQEFTETQYLYVMAQNRTSDKSIECYIRSTANPGGVGHAWVKRRFIDTLFNPKDPYAIRMGFFRRINDEDIETGPNDPYARSRSFVYATLDDNPSIDSNYVATLHQLPEQDQKAFLRGDWEIFAGQFFQTWRNHIHVKDEAINPYFRKFISLDYGFAAPSSVGWWQVDYDGNLHRYRELYKERLTYSEIGKQIRKLTPQDETIDYCVADPAIWGDKSHHKEGYEGESGAETLRNELSGFTGVIAADNDRVIGWGRMRIMLEPNKEGKPQITCSPRCKDSIRTIPGLIHDEIKVEDVNSDGEDHAADEWRYALMSRPNPSKKLGQKKSLYTVNVDADIESYKEQYG